MANFSEKASEKLGQLLRKPATGKLITTQHRRVIAQICDEARVSGLPVERLVSVCIEEYFRDGKPKS